MSEAKQEPEAAPEAKPSKPIVRCERCEATYRRLNWSQGMKCPKCKSPDFFPVTVIGGAVDYTLADRRDGYAIEDIRFAQLAKWAGLITPNQYTQALSRQRQQRQERHTPHIAQVLISEGIMSSAETTAVFDYMCRPRPDEADEAFGSLAVQNKLATGRKVKECMAELRVTAKARHEVPPLGQLMFEKRYLNENQVQALHQMLAHKKQGLIHRIAQAYEEARALTMIEKIMGTKDERPVNGGYTAIDYARPEVRDLAFRFFEEVCNNYDVDGVEADFFRHLTFFRKHAMGGQAGQEELDMMTDLLRRIRGMADDVGAKRGRPILISVRVPDSAELCKAVGLDVERWMKEDLIDLLVVSGYFRLNPWETSVELGHRYGVPVYPCLSESRIKDDEARKVRASLECYRARAMNVLDSGADGVYLFNFFDPHSPLWKEVGAKETMGPLDKTYTTAARGFGNLDFWYEGGEHFKKRSVVTPDTPRPLAPGEPETVELRVGEELDASKATLCLRVDGLAKPGDISVKFNAQPLDEGSKSGVYLEYDLDASLMKRGVNEIAILLGPAAGESKPAVLDLLLRVRRQEDAQS